MAAAQLTCSCDACSITRSGGMVAASSAMEASPTRLADPISRSSVNVVSRRTLSSIGVCTHQAVTGLLSSRILACSHQKHWMPQKVTFESHGRF